MAEIKRNGVKVSLDPRGISSLLNDAEIAKKTEAEVAPQLIALFEKLYPGSAWTSEIGEAKDRKRIIIKTDDRDVPFREANAGRIRKQLRSKIVNSEPIRSPRRKPKKEKD